MITIRKICADDLIGIQTQNLLSLPENYNMKYYYFHLITAPELSWAAVDEKNNVIGYVLAKADDDNPSCGAITSVAVARNYRRLGLAQRLMRQSQRKMIEVYNMKKCQLNVRESNYAAQHLYKNVLGFKQIDIDMKYYADGENGIRMEQDLVALRSELGISDFMSEGGNPPKKGTNSGAESTSEKEVKKDQDSSRQRSSKKSKNKKR